MPWPINLRGFPGSDPLDALAPKNRLLLHMGVTAALTVSLLVCITRVFHLVEFIGLWLEVLEVVGFTLLVAPVLVTFRKSSSLLQYAFVGLPLVLLDAYLEDHYRLHGLRTLWHYVPGTFVARIHPGILRAVATQSVDAVLGGPLALWLSRLIALVLIRPSLPAITPLPFPPSWTAEDVPRPPRDFAFWALRILGLGYLGYLTLLLLGGLGPAAWPASVAQLFQLTYVNPYLAMNTAGKVCLMAGLASVAAFNVGIRRPAVLALLVGHALSVASCLFFYLTDVPSAPYHAFLLVSALVDVGMVGLFVWLLVSPRAPALSPSADELPAFFSLPTFGWRIALVAGGLYTAGVVAVSLLGRLGVLPGTVLGALFRGSDPALGNSLALHGTLCVLCLMMGLHQRVRTALVAVVVFSLSAAVALGLVLLAVGSLNVDSPQGTVNLAPSLLVHVLGYTLALSTLAVLRSLSFNVEYAVTSFRAPSAQAIAALHDAAFPGDDRSDVLQAVDRFAGTIRGRKRGVLNFPFWLVERIFPVLFGIHPEFSSMSPEEAQYFLRTRLIRTEEERRQAFCPELADVAYQLSVAAQSIVLFAAYAGLSQREKIGYIPPGARSRLQAGGIPAAPPGATPAQLPRDAQDPLNWPPPAAPAAARVLPAPRVSTPLREPRVPLEADYLVMGSGPGGAMAAYRLACSHPGARIVVLESGGRYSPLQDFTERELEMVAKLYKEGGVQQTKRADMIILQGECVGGGSVVNNAVCYQMPPAVRAAWAAEYGLELTGLDAAYAQVAAELGIGPLGPSGINARVAETFRRAVQGVNAAAAVPTLREPEVVEVNAPAAVGDGLWNLGSKYLGKRTVLETYVPWAESRGVEFVPHATAVSMECTGRRATSVLVHTMGGDLVRVKVNRALVVAGGVISSSQFLMQSGVPLPVGQGLSCNFALPAIFDFDEPMNAFDGEQITLGARDLQNRAIFETYFNPPGAFALTVPFYFGRHLEVMRRYPNLLNFGALVGSEPNGVLDRKLDPLNGHAFDWRLGMTDQHNLRFALETLLQLGEKAGARRALLPTRPGVEFHYGRDLAADFSRALASRPLRLEDLSINTAHPQGGNRMAASDAPGAKGRVVDEHARLVGYDNVHVTDGSVFPTSLTVNPQWTIMALSSLAARHIA